MQAGAGNGNGEALHARAGDAVQAGEADWDGGAVQARKADGDVDMRARSEADHAGPEMDGEVNIRILDSQGKKRVLRRRRHWKMEYLVCVCVSAHR